MTKTPRILVLAALGASLAAAPAAADPATLDALARASELDAGQGAVVWSRYDGTITAYRHDRGPRDRCDLYILSLTTGAERRIDAASTAASESHPTLWHGELAWI